MQIRDNNNLALVTILRDPFYDKPLTAPGPFRKKNKRTQRYRSTAKSRICGMTVGDIRYCFQQLRTIFHSCVLTLFFTMDSVRRIRTFVLD